MLLLVVLHYVLLACLASDLPSFLPQCSINDPNEVGNCILKAAEALKPRLRKGIPEIGIPSYDPLVIPQFDFQQETDLLNYTARTWNWTIRGMDNYDFMEIRYDPKTTTFYAKLKFDPLSINSIYTLNGRLLFIPVRGNGKAEATFGPINATIKITGKIIKRMAVDYYDPTNVKVTLSFGDMSVHYGGLFDGDEELAAMTNELVNQNSKAIIDAAAPAFEGVSEKLIMGYVKWLAKTFPFHKLFPHSLA